MQTLLRGVIQEALLATQTSISWSFPTIFQEDSWIWEERQHNATRFGVGKGPEWQDIRAEGKIEVISFYLGLSLGFGVVSMRFSGLEGCLCWSSGGGTHREGAQEIVGIVRGSHSSCRPWWASFNRRQVEAWYWGTKLAFLSVPFHDPGKHGEILLVAHISSS